LWRQPVTDDHRAQAVLRVEAAEGSVDAEVVAVAGGPGTAVDEEEHREVLVVLRQVEVELVLLRVCILAVVVGEVLHRLDLERSRLGLLLVRGQRRRKRHGEEQERIREVAEPGGHEPAPKVEELATPRSFQGAKYTEEKYGEFPDLSNFGFPFRRVRSMTRRGGDARCAAGCGGPCSRC